MLIIENVRGQKYSDVRIGTKSDLKEKNSLDVYGICMFLEVDERGTSVVYRGFAR
jgi:hypothetical protein